MGLDVWFRQDVARILASTQGTLAQAQGAVTPLDPERANAYRQGFADALQSVAVAFGLERPGSVPAPRSFAGPAFVKMPEPTPVQTSCVYSISGSELVEGRFSDGEDLP